MTTLNTKVSCQVVKRLQDVIYYSLDQHLYDNAIFFAERLVAYESTRPQHVHLLARCYCATGQVKDAYELLRGSNYPACQYLFAWCAVKLNHLPEAENALCNLIKEAEEHDNATSSSSLNAPDDQDFIDYYESHPNIPSSTLDGKRRVQRCTTVDMASVYCLQASVYRKLQRNDMAQSMAQKALALNSFLWSAYDTLNRAQDIDAKQLNECLMASASESDLANERSTITGYFKVDSLYRSFDQLDDNAQQAMENTSDIHDDDDNVDNSRDEHDTQNSNRNQSVASRKAKKLAYKKSYSTPTDRVEQIIEQRTPTQGAVIRSHKRTFIARQDSEETIPEKQKIARIDSDHRQRHQAQLSDTVDTLSTQGATASAAATDDTHSEETKALLKIDKAVFTQLETLLQTMAVAVWHLTHYRCQQAIDTFKRLPQEQQLTGWVSTQMARAYFEMSNYIEAETLFKRVREREPYRMDGQEYYSSLSWHLRREAKISSLARELIDMNRLSPQAWCALGNCFSLQRDRSNAMTCFERAIKIDPSFAYAYTLCGHEQFSEEDWDRAQNYYRKAISIDPRHYNAWYGLGMVYMRLDRVDVAEKHLLRAIAIHPNNPALVCRLGMVYERLRDRDRALAVYARASKLDPRNTLVRFKHAKALMELGQNQKALEELTVAYDLAPREANIHLLLGHVYQRLNDRASALRHYTWALNLTTRQRHIVHEAIQRLNEQTISNEGNVSVLTVGEGGDESVFI